VEENAMELSNSQYKKLLKKKRDKEWNEKFNFMMKKQLSPKQGYLLESRGENHILLRRIIP
jgi:hypothetical protein